MDIVFFGTPDFAVPPLTALCKKHRIVAVVTQPDRAKDRKGNLIPSPLKSKANELSLNVLSFENIKKEGVETLKGLNADLFVTAAYGQILSKEILDIPKLGVYNIHASVLPKYRGSSPVQSAIIGGESETGVTIMKTELGLDTGDMLLIKKLSIGENENALQLTQRLSEAGAAAIVEAIDLIESGRAVLTKQDESKATKCIKLTKESGKIDWSQSAQIIHNQIRGLYPSPACHTYHGGKYVKILSAEIVETNSRKGAGEWSGLTVSCGCGSIKINCLQPENKRALSAAEYISGYGAKGFFN